MPVRELEVVFLAIPWMKENRNVGLSWLHQAVMLIFGAAGHMLAGPEESPRTKSILTFYIQLQIKHLHQHIFSLCKPLHWIENLCLSDFSLSACILTSNKLKLNF